MSGVPARGGRALLTAVGLGAALAAILTGCSAGNAPAEPPTPAQAPLLAPIAADASTAGHRTAEDVAAPAVAPVSVAAGATTTSTPAATAARRPSPSEPSARTATPVSTGAGPPSTRVGRTALAARSTCPHLTIRVIRGSAAFGREFAALQFTNSGTSMCRLNGYPTATLLRGGSRIGNPSQPASTRTSTFLLAPGATAESQLNDYVSCQAPLSDTIRVVAPGSSFSAARPAQLRACTLRVSALGAPQ